MVRKQSHNGVDASSEQTRCPHKENLLVRSGSARKRPSNLFVDDDMFGRRGSDARYGPKDILGDEDTRSVDNESSGSLRSFIVDDDDEGEQAGPRNTPHSRNTLHESRMQQSGEEEDEEYEPSMSSDMIDDMKVDELKEELVERGLSASGKNKDALRERLKNFFKTEGQRRAMMTQKKKAQQPQPHKRPPQECIDFEFRIVLEHKTTHGAGQVLQQQQQQQQQILNGATPNNTMREATNIPTNTTTLEVNITEQARIKLQNETGANETEILRMLPFVSLEDAHKRKVILPQKDPDSDDLIASSSKPSFGGKKSKEAAAKAWERKWKRDLVRWCKERKRDLPNEVTVFPDWADQYMNDSFTDSALLDSDDPRYHSTTWESYEFDV
eukprot:jgi/Bigna1/130991/aug1.13_g5699